MKWFICIVTFIFSSSNLFAQNISGKWYGKAFQGAGELCTECNFELDLSQNKTIYGESYTYIPDTTDIRIGLTGYFDGDTIRLAELENQIFRKKTPINWYPCLKEIMLKYHNLGDAEYLLGRGIGKSLEDGEPCIPARFVFARSKEILARYIAAHKDSIFYTPPLPPPLTEFTTEFKNTGVVKTNEIEVNHTNLQLRLSDYLRVDNDTVSVYLNRNIIAKGVPIVKRSVRVDFNLDMRTPLNELLLFAENLGKIPPNTSLLEIVDGDKIHKIRIESSRQKTAAIYLRYKKNLND